MTALFMSLAAENNVADKHNNYHLVMNLVRVVVESVTDKEDHKRLLDTWHQAAVLVSLTHAARFRLQRVPCHLCGHAMTFVQHFVPSLSRVSSIRSLSSPT